MLILKFSCLASFLLLSTKGDDTTTSEKNPIQSEIYSTLNPNDRVDIPTVPTGNADVSTDWSKDKSSGGTLQEAAKEDLSCGPPPEIEKAEISRPVAASYPLNTKVNYTCDFGYVPRGNKHFIKCRLDKDLRQAVWTTPNISCVPRSCGDPGFVQFARRVGLVFTFPNRVTFECEEGFKLRGLGTRYCQPSGTWSGRLPSCEKITCEIPRAPPNGRVSYSSLEYESELKYECEKGFTLQDHSPRICSENGTWTGKEPICSDIVCKDPPAPEYGSVRVTTDKPKWAFFTCSGNRKLQGFKNLTVLVAKCLESGQWTFPTPSCIETCTIPEVSKGSITKYPAGYTIRPERYEKIPVGTEVDNNEKFLLRCSRGYEPLGKPEKDALVSCRDGNLSPNPECKPASCHSLPPETKNGEVSSANHQHGGNVVYECKTDFIKEKEGNITCSLGTWKGETPICKDGRCYTDGLHYPGIEAIQQDFYKSGEYFELICARGYIKRTTEGFFVQCQRGNWIFPDRPCVPAPCENPPPEKEHTTIVRVNKTHGGEVAYECQKNYYKFGHARVICEFGEWKGSPPTCKDSRCYLDHLEFPGIIKNGKNIYNDQEYFQPSCSEGYTLRNLRHKLKCIKGRWQDSLSPCIPTPCENPPPEKEHTTIVRVSRTHHGEVVYECQKNYYMFVYERVICEFGEWKGSPPTCNDSRCYLDHLEFPGLVKNGRNVYSDKEYFQPSCSEGYILRDLRNSKLQCIKGQWQDSLSPCISKMNGIFGFQHDHISVSEKNRSISLVIERKNGSTGSVTLFLKTIDKTAKSNEDYVAHYHYVNFEEGLEQKTVSIKIIDDDIQEEKEEFIVSINTTDKTLLGSVNRVTVEIVDDDKKITKEQCLTDGEKFLGLSEELKGIYKNSDFFTPSCEAGYKLFRDYPYGLRCELGQWVANVSGQFLPVCTKGECSEDPPLLLKGKVQKLSVEHNSTAAITTVTYECDEGYILEGTATLRCLNGEWEGNPPLCIHGSLHGYTTESAPYDSGQEENSLSEPGITLALSLLPSSTISTHSGVSIDVENVGESFTIGDNTCHCTFQTTDSYLMAYADNELLDYNSKVKNGTSVKFLCKQFGYFRLKGSKESTCLDCRGWSSPIPYCTGPQRDDVTVVFDENIHLLPGGIIGLKMGKSTTITCYDNYYYPEWIVPTTSGVFIQANRPNTALYNRKLTIENARIENGGEYTCSNYAKKNNFSFEIQIVEPPVLFVHNVEVQPNQEIGLKVNDSIRLICSSRIQSPQWRKPLPSKASVTTGPDRKNGSYFAYLDIVSARPEDGGKYVCIDFQQYSWNIYLRIEVVRCPPFTSVDELIVEYDRNQEVYSNVTFSCKTLWQNIVGSRTLKCMPNGSWSGTPPECKDIACPKLKVNETEMKISYSKGLVVGSKATFLCVSPRQRAVRSEIRCGYNGDWSDEVPHCENMTCPDLKVNELEMKVSYSHNFVVGSRATFECLASREIVGSSEIMCEKGGTWSGAVPFCKSVSGCPPLQISSNLIIKPQKPFYSFGEFITFSCPEGKILDREVYKIICMHDAWSDENIPNCVDK